MKNFLYCMIVLATVFFHTGCSEKINPVDYVDPFIGTASSRYFYFRSAAAPWGMVYLGPDTQPIGSWNSGYLYDTLSIKWFSHIHKWQMAGVPVMPATGEFKGHKGMYAYQSGFSHERETAKPGYYQVYLDDYDINVELTATERTGFHKYTFPESDSSYILFDIGAQIGQSDIVTSSIQKVNDKRITGKFLVQKTWRRPKDTWVYFVAEVNKPITTMGGWKKSKHIPDVDEISGEDIGGYFAFNTAKDEEILLKVGISFTSVEGAVKNMQTEIPHWNFDEVKMETQDKWNTYLSRIEVKGGTEEQKIKFYTDLFRSIERGIMEDVDGKYCDMTGEKPVIRQLARSKTNTQVAHQHNFDSNWGSHWSLNILWPIIFPEVYDNYLGSMVRMYEHSGLLPRGPSGGNYTFVMIGDPSTPMIAAALNKGIHQQYKVKTAYEGVLKNLTTEGLRIHNGYDHNDPLPDQLESYNRLGYVAHDAPNQGAHGKASASLTLYFAYQDWCTAQIARSIGDSLLYDSLITRSKNYKNIYHPSLQLVYPRLSDGSFFENEQIFFDLNDAPGFCETNAITSSFFIPHDIEGMIEMHGGMEAFTYKLDSFFREGQKEGFSVQHGKHGNAWIDYGNQDGTGMVHLFNYTDKPWLTQYWLNQVYDSIFSGVTPYSGYAGDEDQGQMGSVSALMALGIFSVDGGASLVPEYDLTVPFFDEIILHLNPEYYPGKSFKIICKNRTRENKYIKNISLNGKNIPDLKIKHSDLAKGGELVFELGPYPVNNN